MSNKISWTDQTWNPVHGCTKISAGCKNCYAERMSKRLAGRCGYPPAPDNFKVTLRPDRLEQPLKWRKPRRVFVVSMGDLFHEDVPFAFIGRVMSVAALAMQRHGHVFQFLTKRPARMLEFCHSGYLTVRGWKRLPFWLGVTIENQDAADERIPLLLQTPAAVRFVSAEPLLGSLDLTRYLWATGGSTAGPYRFPSGKVVRLGSGVGGQMMSSIPAGELHWTVTGGETGPGARLSKHSWFQDLRDQCQAARVPFHFKSWGEWMPVAQSGNGWGNVPKGTPEKFVGSVPWVKMRGHLLDGVEHREMPEESK